MITDCSEFPKKSELFNQSVARRKSKIGRSECGSDISSSKPFDILAGKKFNLGKDQCEHFPLRVDGNGGWIDRIIFSFSA